MFEKCSNTFSKRSCYFSELAHEGEPIDSIHPIEHDVIHFLDITNNGLVTGLAPNQKANDLWARISQRV